VLVSGSRTAGKTSFVRVEAEDNQRQRLRKSVNVTLVPPADWAGKTLASSPASVQIIPGEVRPETSLKVIRLLS
jgi:hypothetical protein